MFENLMDPFTLNLDTGSGDLQPATSTVERHLSDMRGLFVDRLAEERLLQTTDPLIYQVLQHDVPNQNGQLIVCTTVIQPGRVGDEYYMTKGHCHEKRDTAEIYLGLQGTGKLLMQADDRWVDVDVKPGTVAYVPPNWSHRTANIGERSFIFLAIYPADAGHDYGSVEQTGFMKRVVAHEGVPSMVVAPLAAPT